MRARAGVVIAAVSLITACSLLVETGDLAGGADPRADSRDGASSRSAEASVSDAQPRGSDRAATADGAPAPNPGVCAAQGASCGRQSSCCSHLHCGDDQKCLVCLPKFDDCKTNDACCSGNCDTFAEICL